MADRKIALAASGLAAAGLIAGGATFAYADAPTASPSTTPTAGASTQASGGQNAQNQKGGDAGGRGQSSDTAVTGDEAQKVIDAVQAKNSGVTITEVRKDPDGTYDAVGTSSDGSRVMYDVSTDLATITAGGGGGHQGGGGKGEAGGSGSQAGRSGQADASAPASAPTAAPSASTTP